MTTDDQLISALKKIRKLVDDSYFNGHIGWTYDSDATREAENRTLLRLVGDKVIDTVWTDESGDFFPDKNGVLITGEENFGAYDMTTSNLTKHAIIGGFNPPAYEHLCLRLGIDPYKNTRPATLHFEGFETPVVSMGGEVYIFTSLHRGKKKALLMRVLQKYPGQLLTLERIKTAKILSEALENETSFKAILDNSLFVKDGPLSPFFSIANDTITYYPTRNLTLEQATAIKEYAKS